MGSAPEFLILSAEDCRAILERNHVGRIAFIRDTTVDIEPIGYVCQGNWIFLRSAWGAKLEALQHRPYVAFEIDEFTGPFDWQSVVVHGTIYQLGEGPAGDEYDRALAAIRTVMPETLTSDDPVPSRTFVYGLHIDTMSGRMARSEPFKDGERRAKAPGHQPPKRKPPDVW